MTSLIQRCIPSSDCQQRLITRVETLYQLILTNGCLQHPGQCGKYLLIDFWFEMLWHFSSEGQSPQSIFHKLRLVCDESISKTDLLEVLQYRCHHPSSACFNFIGRAIFYGDVATLELLLQYGVDPNLVGKGVNEECDGHRHEPPCFDGTPLAYILSRCRFLHPTITVSKRYEMLRVLLLNSKYPVDMNALQCKRKSKTTPLHDVVTLWCAAAHEGMPDRSIFQEIADFLVANGANPDVHRTMFMKEGNLRGQFTLSDTAREWSTSMGFDTSKWPGIQKQQRFMSPSWPQTKATTTVAWRHPVYASTSQFH